MTNTMETNNNLEMFAEELISFAQKAVQTRSYSDEEEALANLVIKEMQALDYDVAFIDSVGNAVGRVGDGDTIIHFDSHMDTVEVKDGEEWEYPPFSGTVADGKLYGRGSVDMKSGLAASIFAAGIAKKLGYLEGKTVYVTGSVCEEYCDGENLKLFYQELNLKPNYVIICEPSDNLITVGHKGKAQIRIKTHGISAHGSAPEKGINAVYEMAEIISRVEELNKGLAAQGEPHGTIVLSDISCVSASLNAVPSECSIYLDRRLALGENLDQVKSEMDQLVAGKRASWEVGTLCHTSWKGKSLVYKPMHEPWEIDGNHPLTLACTKAYEETLGRLPEKYDFWDFGTNAVTPVAMGIPTIGFGPGEYKLSHMKNEHCSVEKIKEACRFYLRLINSISVV